MSKPMYIVDKIGDMVSAVSNKLLTQLQAIDSNIQGVQYYYGHGKEIIETLAQKDQNRTYRYQKYPAICLIQDFPEQMGTGLGIASTVKLHLIIVCSTLPSYKAEDRYNNNFKPILYPIYYEFLNQIFKSGAVLVASVNQIIHTKIDRLYWGREGLYGNQGNVFNDHLDAIEIQDLQLKFYQQNC